MQKFVAIFASHQESAIVTQNLSSVYQPHKIGSGQILPIYRDLNTPAPDS
jgi:hypothetical protein